MAAFDDRCAIVQRGGGRLATFPYPEMTVIHYNSRNRDGELMVLTQTPSPIGNTLPLPKPLHDEALHDEALPLLDEVRRWEADIRPPGGAHRSVAAPYAEVAKPSGSPSRSACAFSSERTGADGASSAAASSGDIARNRRT